MNNEELKKLLMNINSEIIIESITKISIFDFDSTLVASPEPETGKLIWKEKTGEDWPHEGWWGKNSSLDLDVFDIPVIPSTIEAYRFESMEPTTYVVMMTGRLPKNANHVKSILEQHDLEFDTYLYKKGGDTLSYKLRKLSQMIETFPNVTTIENWDDRELHIEGFSRWGDEQSINVKINKVVAPEHIKASAAKPKKEPKLLYTAIVLDQESREALKERFKDVIPENWKTFCHHMTITFMKPLPEDKAGDLGKTIELTATHLGKNDTAMCVSVHGYSLDSGNEHITVAVDVLNGGKPGDSKNIAWFETIGEPLKLSGVVTEVMSNSNDK